MFHKYVTVYAKRPSDLTPAALMWWRRQDRKALERGLVRVCPVGQRGRIYATREDKKWVGENAPPGNTHRPKGGGIVDVKSTAKATLGIRVIRANGDIEDYPSVDLK